MRRILLVDPDEMSADMLSRRLRKKGYEVIVAENGKDGIARAQSISPALILLDMSLPDVDALAVVRVLKATKNTQCIPVIALTATAMSADRDNALAAGCGEFDTKPTDFLKLLAKIEAALGMLSRAPEERRA